MKKMDNILAELQERAQKMSLQPPNEIEQLGAVEYECDICKDTLIVFSHYDERPSVSYEVFKDCECKERKAWRKRFKSAAIPEEFTKVTLENYKQETEMQTLMLSMTEDYLTSFPANKKELQEKGMENFGLIATLGEQRIRSAESESRSALKTQHNSFGVGKTHLHIALSKRLIKLGFNVLIISDVEFTDDAMSAKRMNDEGETFSKLMHGVMNADILVWDDIGKAKPTEAKEMLYYNIINERYKKQMPIVFNSNEDRGTLADRIGYAAQSRLIGRCGNYLMDAEGEDWRFKR